MNHRPQLLPLLVSSEHLPLVPTLLHRDNVDGERAAKQCAEEERSGDLAGWHAWRRAWAGPLLVVRVRRVKAAQLRDVLHPSRAPAAQSDAAAHSEGVNGVMRTNT